jgi:hypothetical protein
MMDFISKDRKKMDQFRNKCADPQMSLDAILLKAGRERPPVECWELRVMLYEQ